LARRRWGVVAPALKRVEARAVALALQRAHGAGPGAASRAAAHHSMLNLANEEGGGCMIYTSGSDVLQHWGLGVRSVLRGDGWR